MVQLRLSTLYTHACCHRIHHCLLPRAMQEFQETVYEPSSFTQCMCYASVKSHTGTRFFSFHVRLFSLQLRFQCWYRHFSCMRHLCKAKFYYLVNGDLTHHRMCLSQYEHILRQHASSATTYLLYCAPCSKRSSTTCIWATFEQSRG